MVYQVTLTQTLSKSEGTGTAGVREGDNFKFAAPQERMDLRRILQQNNRAARGQSERTHHVEDRERLWQEMEIWLHDRRGRQIYTQILQRITPLGGMKAIQR